MSAASRSKHSTGITCRSFTWCSHTLYLILLLFHFGQQEFRVDVALLKQMLQSLKPHIMRIPLPRFPSLKNHILMTQISVLEKDRGWIIGSSQHLIPYNDICSIFKATKLFSDVLWLKYTPTHILM